ncbi:MAG: hypothetical protein ABI680_04255 [Chthoniobacteraceae bacterium]
MNPHRLSSTESLCPAISACLMLAGFTAEAGLVIEDLGKDYSFDPRETPPSLSHHIADRDKVTGGNTSVRNETAATLSWKSGPDTNGAGYFQRNRDLGQVFNVPAGRSVKLDAMVLRTARGNHAVMAGAAGARMYVQFYRVRVVDGANLRINENGTGQGQRATHGFDHQFNRSDDFVEGAEYVPLRRVTGGRFPAGEADHAIHLRASSGRSARRAGGASALPAIRPDRRG